MKSKLPIMAAAVILLSGCASYRQAYREMDREIDYKYDVARYAKVHAPEDRKNYLASHPDRPEEIRKAIEAGVWANGMTKEEVSLAIIRPHDISRSVVGDTTIEHWTWKGPSRVHLFTFRNGILDSYHDSGKIRYSRY